MPLHDATAQMAVNAQMQWYKWLTTCMGASPLNPDWFSTVRLTHKINYSIIRGKMQVKFSG